MSKHASLKLAKYSQHSADQLPYDKSPIEHLESMYKSKFPEKDMQFWRQQIGRFGVTGAHQTGPISQLSDGLRNRWVCVRFEGSFGARADWGCPAAVSSLPCWPWSTRTCCCLTSVSIGVGPDWQQEADRRHILQRPTIWTW